jgi:dienelactone hydrolase
MNESSWSIRTDDGATIYGLSNNAETARADQHSARKRAVVIVHGLGGDVNEYLHKTAAHFFARHGYDVFRVSLYGEEDGARRLRDCTLQTQAADLRAVIQQKTAGYDDVFATGHSYGGPTVMLANAENLRAVSLWDPSFDLPRLWSLLPARQENGFWIEGRGVEILLGHAMMEEVAYYDRAHCLAIAAAAHFPVQVIHAEHCVYNAPDEISWHSAGHAENERHLVMGADHCFVNADTAQDVLAHSLNWFKRFDGLA